MGPIPKRGLFVAGDLGSVGLIAARTFRDDSPTGSWGVGVSDSRQLGSSGKVDIYMVRYIYLWFAEVVDDDGERDKKVRFVERLYIYHPRQGSDRDVGGEAVKVVRRLSS